ncbi:MAG TPA: DNA polymerase III subunit gamma/tau [Candidatus Saccharimonadales bacterium]
MGKALYRKYRSRKLSEIVGQEHVTTLLENALKSGRIAHAYLFTGPRGVGKTSIARILAHEINELPYSDESIHLDIIEIDAASNNGVDDIRDLREKVNLAPSSAKKKIYIIDEVHMLSKAAFNALLKTLEEPPEHVVFILATTDVDKLPETIISRTQRHTFRRASIEDIKKNLTSIAKEESININSEALELIAQHSDGSYRDSVSLLDQLASSRSNGEEITTQTIETSLGLAPQKMVDNLIESLNTSNLPVTLQLLATSTEQGIQAKILTDQLIHVLQANLSKNPQYVKLLDALLDVGQSHFPSVKLITVLADFIGANKPSYNKTMPAIAAPIPSLAKKATEEHPKERKPMKTIETDVPELPQKLESPKPKTKTNPNGAKVDWADFLESTKASSIALHSVLAKCDAIDDGDTLTIYGRNEFYKKKLETSKFQQIIHELIAEQTDAERELNIIPGAKPSDNATVASVAAMMGGGEEVSLDE